jgi:hypothetical protein
MSFTMAPLLMHSDEVPPAARAALRAAYDVPAERRIELLESAARILYEETDLDCRDIHELVGI